MDITLVYPIETNFDGLEAQLLKEGFKLNHGEYVCNGAVVRVCGTHKWTIEVIVSTGIYGRRDSISELALHHLVDSGRLAMKTIREHTQPTSAHYDHHRTIDLNSRSWFG